MPQEPTATEQAISRAVRENLENVQRATEELNHAVNDVIAACSSTKPANALPSMLRAQSTAASIAAALEVLSRFVAVTLQSGARSPLEAEMSRLASTVTTEASRIAPVPEVPQAPATTAHAEPARLVPEAPSGLHSVPDAPPAVSPVLEMPAPAAPKPDFEPSYQSHSISPEPTEFLQPGPFPDDVEVADETDFDVNRLSAEEQELHRRANRVAKVSMQDIKMLHPEQVRQGRENKDLCVRLRDDIEKAHREYDRRFRPIMDHPVDYFYRWMVEILADGDAHALGEYPYAVHASHR
jgi:hypothetical protein